MTHKPSPLALRTATIVSHDRFVRGEADRIRCWMALQSVASLNMTLACKEGVLWGLAAINAHRAEGIWE